MVEMKGKAQDHPTLLAIVSKFKRYLQCNSLAQVGDFWAAEFLKEFESTLQNNPTLLYHPQHIISIQHVLETKATSTSWTQVIPNQHAITLALPASKLFGFY